MVQNRVVEGSAVYLCAYVCSLPSSVESLANPVSVRFCQEINTLETVSEGRKQSKACSIPSPWQRRRSQQVYSECCPVSRPWELRALNKAVLSQKEMNSFGMFSSEKQSPSMSPPLCAVAGLSDLMQPLGGGRRIFWGRSEVHARQ